MRRILRTAVVVGLVGAILLPAVHAIGADSYFFRWRMGTAPVVGGPEGPEVQFPDEVIPGVDPEIWIDDTSKLLVATVGKPFAFNYTASNVNAASSIGSFPPGMFIDVMSRTISGTPVREGRYTFSLRGYARTAQETRTAASNTVTLEVRPALAIASEQIPTVMIGDPVGPHPVTSNQATTQFSISGGPAFLSFSGNSIVGVPTQSGSWMNMSIVGRNELGDVATIDRPLRVAAEPEATYAARFIVVDKQVSFGPSSVTPSTTVAISNGALPAGLTMANDGRVSGIPSEVGQFTFSVTSSRMGRSTPNGPFSLEVGYAPLTVTAAKSGSAYVGASVALSSQPAVADGTGPFAWTAAGLPAGLSVDPASGQVSGAATGPVGKAPVTFQVTDVIGRKGEAVTDINVLNPQVSVASPGTAMVGREAFVTRSGQQSSPILATLRDAAYPASWRLEGAPTWASITSMNGSTGRLAGSPAAPGPVSFTVVASDVNRVEARATVSFDVLPALVLDPPEFGISPAGQPLLVLRQPEAVGGQLPYRWSLMTAPSWLSIDPASGTLGGTVAEGGQLSFRLVVTDALGNVASTSMSSNVSDPRSAGMALLAPVLLPAYVGEAVSVVEQPTLAKGIAPASWSLTGSGGALQVETSTGNLRSGVTAAAGAFPYTITARDANDVETSASFLVEVFDLPSVTAPTITAAVVDSALVVTRQPGIRGGKAPITWSSTDLPSGLALNAATGVIAGSPTTPGLNVFTIVATDAGGRSSSVPAAFTATVSPLTMTEPSFRTAVLGEYISVARQPQANGGLRPYTWTMSGAPSWLDIDPSSGTISGVPGQVGAKSFGLTVRDALAQSTSTTLSLAVNSPLVITGPPSFSATQTVGQPLVVMSQPAASGGSGRYAWSLSGAPAGVSIGTSSGQISGTVVAAGSWQVVAQVQDEAGANASAVAPLIVATSEPTEGDEDGDGVPDELDFGISAPSVADADVGHPIVTLAPATARNATGTVSWSLAGGPGWLAISQGGVLSGTPQTAGAFSATILASDGVGETATAMVRISVSDEGIVAPRLANLQTIGSSLAVTTQPRVTGGVGPYTWTVSGAPSWVVIDPATGALSGTVGSASASFTVTVTDSGGISRSTGASLTAAPALVLTAPVVAEGEVNRAISVTTQATGGGGKGALQWSVSGRPAWMTVDPANGRISGTPGISDARSYNLTMTIRDAENRTATAPFTFAIYDLLALTPPGLIASLYSPIESKTVQAAARGGKSPYVFSMTDAPSWLVIDTATGRLSGTPLARSSQMITITVVDALGHDISVDAWLDVGESELPPLAFTRAPTLATSQTYQTALAVANQPLATGGFGSRVWSLRDAPSWMTINSSTGVISGSIQTAGPFSATVVVTDDAGAIIEAAISGDADSSPVISPIGTIDMIIGTAANFTPTVTGGTAPYTWSSNGVSTLANAGLSFDTATGAISGTPNRALNYGFNVTVVDAKGRSYAVGAVLFSVTPMTFTGPILVPNPGTVGVTMSVNTQPRTTGGKSPFTYTITDKPDWMNFSASNASISVNAPTEGDWNTTITATDAMGTTQSVTYPISVSKAFAMTVPSTNFFSDSGGTSYFEPSVTGGRAPYAWTMTRYSTGPEPPNWISIDSSNGRLTASPPADANTNQAISLTVTDAQGRTTTRTINLYARGFAINGPVLVQGQSSGSGLVVTTQASVVSGTGYSPITWSLSNAPAWLNVNSSSGALSGNVSGDGDFSPTLTATDAAGRSRSQAFSFNVTPRLSSSFINPGVQYVGEPVSVKYQITGGRMPYRFALTSGTLASWASIGPSATDPTVGEITGVPTTAGSTGAYTVTVTDADGRTTSHNTSFNITAQPVISTPPRFNPAQVIGSSIAMQLQPSMSGGVTPMTWSIENGPSWLNIARVSSSSSAATISGRVDTSDVYPLIIRVTDANGRSATTEVTLDTTVRPLSAYIGDPRSVVYQSGNYYCLTPDHDTRLNIVIVGGKAPFTASLGPVNGSARLTWTAIDQTGPALIGHVPTTPNFLTGNSATWEVVTVTDANGTAVNFSVLMFNAAANSYCAGMTAY